MTDFTRTRAALAEYDRGKNKRARNWAYAETEAHVERAVRIDREAEAKVHEAFASDTAGFNSFEHAQLVHPDDPWLRRLVAVQS